MRTHVHWLTIPLLVAILGPWMPMVGTAQDVEEESATTANGCTLTPRKPAKALGEVVARAGVACAIALEGRQIIVELWQRDGDGNWHENSDANTGWENADQVQPLHDADANGIHCLDLDSGRTRRFKTRIRVSDGSENFTAVFSKVVELDRNCLAESGLRMSGAPVATESGEVETESNQFNEKRLVYCTSRAYEPGWPRPGGRMYAKGSFDCSGGIDGITYIRTRLVRELRPGFYRVEANRATWFRTQDGYRSDLFASCKTDSSSQRDYWTVTREWVERSNGDRFDDQSFWGPGVIRRLKCT